MNDKISIERIRPIMAYILLPLVAFLVLHYYWTLHNGGPEIVIWWWTTIETKLNVLWQNNLPIWKPLLLGLALATILLLDLWFMTSRRLAAYLRGEIITPHKKLVQEHKELRAENQELKQQLKKSRMDLKVKGQTGEEHEAQQWAQMRIDLESQLEQANHDHEKTRQAFSELQGKLNALTQQLEQARGQDKPIKLDLKQTDGDVDSNSPPKAQPTQSQRFESKIKDLKDFIDDNDLT